MNELKPGFIHETDQVDERVASVLFFLSTPGILTVYCNSLLQPLKRALELYLCVTF